jgi:triacylglycerol esterase/lipase EstA (alpha/beta hydrolase family)
LLNSGRLTFHWWLRLIVAAFLLSAWVVVGLDSGIAHADDPSPSSSDASSESSASAPKAEKADSPKQSEQAEAPSPDPVTKPHGDTTTDSTAPAEETAGESEVSVQAKPRVRRNSHKPDLTIASVKPTKPASADPQPSATRTVAAVESQPTRTASPQLAAANVAPPGPSVSSTQPGGSTIRLPQNREVVGLVSDVGVVAMSAVWTAADTVAQIFGPHSFLGLPYALASAVANSAAAVSRTLIGAPPGTSSTGPFHVNYGIINGLSFFNPQTPPPGANDPTIHVTAAHPLPIILLNGTTGTQGANWGVGAPVLANAGYKVYTFNYGNVTNDPNFPIQATDDIRQSAKELDAEIKRVLEETGAPKVILIGHSQGGGILPVYYINNVDGGAAKVSQLIGIAPSNHGTDVMGVVGLQQLPILGPLITAFANALGPALEQQALGNEFQQEVYGNGDTRPGVLYTTITSIYDEVVTPYTQQALTGPNVTNIVIQDLYPGVTAGHEGLTLSPQVWSVVLDALASNPAANPLQSQELAA